MDEEEKAIAKAAEEVSEYIEDSDYVKCTICGDFQRHRYMRVISLEGTPTDVCVGCMAKLQQREEALENVLDQLDILEEQKKGGDSW